MEQQLGLSPVLKALKGALIEEALVNAKLNCAAAADKLKLERTTLVEMLKTYGIRRENYQEALGITNLRLVPKRTDHICKNCGKQEA